MKIIELLNKIANGEPPKHIKVYNTDWYWNDYDGYVTKWSLSTTPDAQHYLFAQYRLDFILDKEVEVIEEEKKIPEKLKSLNNVGNSSDIGEFTDKQQLNNHLLKNKINEIIDYLKSKGE